MENKNDIHDILRLLDLVKAGKIEPITMWKYYVSNWDYEEQIIFYLKLIAIMKHETEEMRQGGISYRFALNHASYLSMKMNEIRQLHQDSSFIQSSGINLPDKINIDNAEVYFIRAIDAKFMIKNGDGYKWIFGENRGQARLGYFLCRIYEHPRPINDLEEYFGVKKLSSSLTNGDLKAKRNDVIRWRIEIDKKIFFDK